MMARFITLHRTGHIYAHLRKHRATTEVRTSEILCIETYCETDTAPAYPKLSSSLLMRGHDHEVCFDETPAQIKKLIEEASDE